MRKLGAQVDEALFHNSIGVVRVRRGRSVGILTGAWSSAHTATPMLPVHSYGPPGSRESSRSRPPPLLSVSLNVLNGKTVLLKLDG